MMQWLSQAVLVTGRFLIRYKEAHPPVIDDDDMAWSLHVVMDTCHPNISCVTCHMSHGNQYLHCHYCNLVGQTPTTSIMWQGSSHPLLSLLLCNPPMKVKRLWRSFHFAIRAYSICNKIDLPEATTIEELRPPSGIHTEGTTLQRHNEGVALRRSCCTEEAPQRNCVMEEVPRRSCGMKEAPWKNFEETTR